MNEETNQVTMEEELNPEEHRKNRWSAFAETTLVDFFTDYKLEKLAVEDGNGNKAKLSRTKDNDIKIEQSSITIL